MLKWLKEAASNVPDEILARAPLLATGFDEAKLPFNRRIRRAVRTAISVIVHLYAGGTKQKHFGNLPATTFVLDIDIGKGGKRSQG